MNKAKGQHFLLSAKARTFSLIQIMRLSDAEAFTMFKEARWGDDAPSCPKCGGQEHYWLETRMQWRCKTCKHTFSVTSGTIFANHKLPLTTYLAAIAIYTNAVKGISALQISRDLNCQYKTAWVLCHKLRETLGDSGEVIKGNVEIDGGYFKGSRNHAKGTDERAVIILRERGQVGAAKSRPFITRSENQAATLKIVKANVDRSATIFADEHGAYNTLHAFYKMGRVNHGETYRGPNGENTNQAESYFSRFRRMQFGQVHKMGTVYLECYAKEVAYREDTRRMANGSIFADITNRCAAAPVSRDFCGYWQGNKRLAENLVA
jgi:transposase-like protein